VKVCPKLPQKTALLIGQEVWDEKGDIRDIILISKLVQKRDGPDEIAEIITIMRKYGDG
jgi:hypothetical protein